ncbi:hypothetical protein Smp_173460 [Schistosoma mansoni]|uniref:hypothetical protein n=1 Tax=Schistosoma mansoni TaxID=6183 RepID=UPI00019B375B|nr:hypothetical protein Smp_173460 [Schistosoma mansoni]|eukprot:XP_018645463.1 hypothetical protein Smp_173460 [Schistosoma mansoni]
MDDAHTKSLTSYEKTANVFAIAVSSALMPDGKAETSIIDSLEEEITLMLTIFVQSRNKSLTVRTREPPPIRSVEASATF